MGTHPCFHAKGREQITSLDHIALPSGLLLREEFAPKRVVPHLEGRQK